MKFILLPFPLFSLSFESLTDAAEQKSSLHPNVIYDNVLRLEEQTSALDSGMKTKIALQRIKAKMGFQESVEFVCSTMTKMKINKGRIAKLNDEINAIYYNKSDQNEDELSDISDDDMMRIRNQQENRQRLKDEINELQHCLFNHFDVTLGGLRALSKYSQMAQVRTWLLEFQALGCCFRRTF